MKLHSLVIFLVLATVLVAAFPDGSIGVSTENTGLLDNGISKSTPVESGSVAVAQDVSGEEQTRVSRHLGSIIAKLKDKIHGEARSSHGGRGDYHDDRRGGYHGDRRGDYHGNRRGGSHGDKKHGGGKRW